MQVCERMSEGKRNRERGRGCEHEKREGEEEREVGDMYFYSAYCQLNMYMSSLGFISGFHSRGGKHIAAGGNPI